MNREEGNNKGLCLKSDQRSRAFYLPNLRHNVNKSSDYFIKKENALMIHILFKLILFRPLTPAWLFLNKKSPFSFFTAFLSLILTLLNLIALAMPKQCLILIGQH